MNRKALIARRQLAKASKLLSIVDKHVRFTGMPMLAGKRGVAALEVFGVREWRALARQNGIVPTSKDVIPLILELVEERGTPVPPPRQMTLRKVAETPLRRRESA